MAFLDLPDELLAQVAIHLSFCDLLHLQQACTRLFDVVNSTAALQYAIELRVAGMIDNQASHLVPGDRLRILLEKEKAWREIDLSDRKVLPLNHNPSGIYDLTGGVLLLGERKHSEGNTGTDGVHTVHLHSAFEEGAASHTRKLWSHLDLGKQVIDVGLAVHEHDLIAIVTYSYIHEAQLWASIDIHLIQHSTGQPHPAAAKPVLHFDNVHYLPGHSSIMLEVAGDTLCFLFNNYFPFVSADPVTMLILNWKTGHPKVGQKRLYSDPTMFNSFVLLSPDTVALPIIPNNSIEICYFGKELAAPPPPAPATGDAEAIDAASSLPNVPLLDTTCILELPPLDHGALVLRMTCRCEPNPRGPSKSATHVDTRNPFYSDPEEAIMVLHLHMRLPLGATRVYTMIVHRSSLLKITRYALEAREQAKARGEGPEPLRESPPPATSAPIVANFLPHQPQDNLNILPLNNHPVFAPLSHGDEERDDADLKLPPSVPWKDWGPAHTRWFQDEISGTRWITTTCGQRFVRVRSDGRLYVYDFNQRAMRRFLQQRALAGEPVGSRKGEKVIAKGVREVWAWSGRVENVNENGQEMEDEDEDEDEDNEVWEMAEDIEADADAGVELLLPIDVPQDHIQDGAGVLVDTVGEGEQANVEAGVPTALTNEGGAASHHDGALLPEAGPSTDEDGNDDEEEDPRLRLKVVLGTTVIGYSSAWAGEMESALPYIERSVPISEEYESVLVDEDIIVGLKMDANGRHIKEVVLHRMGGPLY
ncbi:hypothetical protein BD309DRAFT_998100 [Dichomitus squalens]|nr:hypothetical protein BD309DRAFT_998100 [Dichomitus squalens]